MEENRGGAHETSEVLTAKQLKIRPNLKTLVKDVIHQIF